MYYGFLWTLDFGLKFSELNESINEPGSEENDLYCPSCRAEYRPGFTQCADCSVDLVYELPEEQPRENRPFSTDHDPNADLVAVYSTYKPTDVMLIKSLLNAEEIIYNFQGEHFKGSGVFVVPAMLFVTKADAERVTEMLKDHGLE